MKRNVYFVLILVAVVAMQLTLHECSSAQQLPQYTLFSIAPYAFNPAVAGTEDFVHAQASYRSQWSGFNGAPQTIYLSVHAPLNKKTIGYGDHKKFQNTRWASLGGIVSNDKTGPISNTLAHVTYAYNMPLSKNALRLSFGLSGGLKSFSYDPNGFLVNIPDPNDQYILNGYTQNIADLAAGTWLYSKRFFFGLSGYQLLNFKSRDFSYNTSNQIISSGSLSPHYFLTAGYKINFNAEFFAVPSVLIKSLGGSIVSYDINCKFVFRNDYYVGAAYRNQDALSLFLGLCVNKQLEVSYAYDAITSSLYRSTFGSNEIVVGYRFMIKPKTICPEMFW